MTVKNDDNTKESVIRPLAPTEAMYAKIGFYAGRSVQVTGPLDIEALTEAFHALQRRYPLFKARIKATTGGYELVTAPHYAPEIAINTGDLSAPLTGIEFDQQRFLSALSVVNDGARARVTLLTQHSIADGHHALTALADLWALYTAIVSGQPPTTDPLPVPEPLESLLAARGMSVPASDEAAPLPAESVEHDHLVLTTSRLQLSAEATAALIEISRQQHVTLNALVSAGILLAEAKTRDVPLTEFSIGYPIDLRRRLSPPLECIPAGTNVLGYAFYSSASDTAPELVPMARRVDDELRNQLAAGHIPYSLIYVAKAITSNLPQPRTHINSTSWGKVAPLIVPPDLVVEDLTSTMSVKERPHGQSNYYVQNLYNDRLTIEIHHLPETAAQERQRLTVVEQALNDATSTA